MTIRCVNAECPPGVVKTRLGLRTLAGALIDA